MYIQLKKQVAIQRNKTRIIQIDSETCIIGSETWTMHKSEQRKKSERCKRKKNQQGITRWMVEVLKNL